MSTPSSALATAASDLRIVTGKLMRRLRSEGALPISHIAVLSRLHRLGPQTTSGLAAGERMRPQSMAQTVSELKKEGLVAARPDTADRRQVLLELTERGHETLDAERRRREDWLSRAIADELSAEEQQLLVKAVALLRRIAEL
jgi:DNA-binding MarR family transcriptional regulator